MYEMILLALLFKLQIIQRIYKELTIEKMCQIKLEHRIASKLVICTKCF